MNSPLGGFAFEFVLEVRTNLHQSLRANQSDRTLEAQRHRSTPGRCSSGSGSTVVGTLLLGWRSPVSSSLMAKLSFKLLGTRTPGALPLLTTGAVWATLAGWSRNLRTLKQTGKNGGVAAKAGDHE